MDETIPLLPAGSSEDSTTYASAADIKQSRQKELIVEQLKKTPIVQMVCEKLGIGRSTYYRWRQEDKEFAKDCDEALEDGFGLVNDLAESQLLGAIRDQNMTAIVFWLRNHHRKYANKLEVNANIKNLNEQLTPEQQATVEQALRLASLIDTTSSEEQKQTHGTNTSNSTTKNNRKPNSGAVPDTLDDTARAAGEDI